MVTALDLIKGTLLWQVVHGETPDAIKKQSTVEGREHSAYPDRPGILGTLTTKSLVIIGDCGLFTDEHRQKGAAAAHYDKVTGEQHGAVISWTRCRPARP